MAAPTGTRVPFRIYKFESTSSNVSLYNKIPSASSVSFLDVVTEDDVDFTKSQPTVEVSLEAFQYKYEISGGDSISLDAYLDKGTYVDHYWYVIAPKDNKRWYIRKAPNQRHGTNREIFEFYVSPQRIEPSFEKLQSETKTRGGWEIQHWGSRLTEVQGV